MSGLTPSQAEDVEFKTRLASYSDDELNSINANSKEDGEGGTPTV